jgi:hypothetical protein
MLYNKVVEKGVAKAKSLGNILHDLLVVSLIARFWYLQQFSGFKGYVLHQLWH